MPTCHLDFGSILAPTFAYHTARQSRAKPSLSRTVWRLTGTDFRVRIVTERHRKRLQGLRRLSCREAKGQMKFARFANILALKTSTGEVLGFHAVNLQVAELDPCVWDAVSAAGEIAKDAGANSEATSELQEWNDERDPSVKDQTLGQTVRSLTINIAQICNLKCSYCAAGGDGTYGSNVKEIDLTKVYDQLRFFLKAVPDGGNFVITFLGGEPLIYPSAIAMIHRFVDLQIAGRGIRVRYDIVTNGTLITQENAELLASLKAHVTISLDGPAEINDRQRRTASGAGSTARTLKGLETLLKIRDRIGSISVGSVFGKHSTDVVATYRFLQPYSLDSLKFDFAAAENDSEASAAYIASLLEVASEAFRTGGERELRRIGLFDRYFQILDSRERIGNHCGAGKSLMQIDTSGKLYACQWFVNDAKEVLGDGTKIDSEKRAAYAHPLTELNSCNDCWARNLCGGGCMFVNKVKNGNKHLKDNEFCTRTRSIIAKGIEYYAQLRKQA